MPLGFADKSITPPVEQLEVRSVTPDAVILQWKRPQGTYDGYLIAVGDDLAAMTTVERIAEAGVKSCRLARSPQGEVYAVRTYLGPRVGKAVYVRLEVPASAPPKPRSLFVFERLKGLFCGRAETQSVFGEARTPEELLRRLRENLARNQKERERLVGEVLELEVTENQEITAVREGHLTPRRERLALRGIQRVRRQLEHLDRRMLIFERNIDLHLHLIAKLKDMQAIQLKGLDDEQVQTILLDFEERLEHYLDALKCPPPSRCDAEQLAGDENTALASLKAEILNAEPPPRTHRRDAPLNRHSQSAQQEYEVE